MTNPESKTTLAGNFHVWILVLLLSWLCLALPLYSVEMIAFAPVQTSSQETHFLFKVDDIIVKQSYSTGATTEFEYTASKLKPAKELMSNIGLLLWLNILVTVVCGSIAAVVDGWPLAKKFLQPVVPPIIKDIIVRIGINKIFRWGKYISALCVLSATWLLVSLPDLLKNLYFEFISGFLGTANVNFSGYSSEKWGPSLGGGVLMVLLVIVLYRGVNAFFQNGGSEH